MESETGLWQDVSELPDALAATLERRDGFEEVASLLGAGGVRRIVATGNGAAYYVAVALWLAALEAAAAPEVVPVPSGLVARGGFRWRPGDALLAISSSGEFRDLVEAVASGAPRPYAAITANAESTLGAGAAACALVSVLHQRAVTHTQAFCGAVAAGLAVLAEVTDEPGLRAAVALVPEHAAVAVEAARGWPEDAGELGAEAAVAFGSGPAWAGALEAALLLKEVACIPAGGVETREGATSAMMALRPGRLALSLPTAADPLLDEAEQICTARGATVLRAPVPAGVDPRLASIVSHPAAAALAERLGIARGLDVDRPAWTDDYYRVARSSG